MQLSKIENEYFHNRADLINYFAAHCKHVVAHMAPAKERTDNADILFPCFVYGASISHTFEDILSFSVCTLLCSVYTGKTTVSALAFALIIFISFI